MNVIPPYSRSSSNPMLAQTFMSSRSLTQGLDIINMEPSAPGVRTSVINSYLSNTGNQNISNLASPNALMASLESDINSVQGNSSSNAVGASSSSNANSLTHQSNQDPTIVSPKIFSVIKNSILQALNVQIANSQSVGPSSNVNALLANEVAPGSMVDAAGAQINSFVNSLIFTVQSQTNLSAQEDVSAPALLSHVSNSNALNSQSTVVGTNSVDQAVNASAKFIASPSNSENLTPNSPNTTANQSDANSSTTDLYQAYDRYMPGLDFARAPAADGSAAALASAQNSSANVGLSGASTQPTRTTTQQQEVAQNISNIHGWVVGRVYSSMQSMIEMLAVTQSEGVDQPGGNGISPSVAGLDSLIQSANSLFATMGLTSTVTASTLQTALQDIQRNLMSAPAQGQWINVVA